MTCVNCKSEITDEKIYQAGHMFKNRYRKCQECNSLHTLQGKLKEPPKRTYVLDLPHK